MAQSPNEILPSQKEERTLRSLRRGLQGSRKGKEQKHRVAIQGTETVSHAYSSHAEFTIGYTHVHTCTHEHTHRDAEETLFEENAGISEGGKGWGIPGECGQQVRYWTWMAMPHENPSLCTLDIIK